MLRKLLLYLLPLTFIYSLAHPYKSWSQSQNDPAVFTPTPPKTDISVPSPTVASLGRYGLTPVSYYTGIPQVSIPIWEVKSGGLRLPISLNYSNNGLKVTQEAGWVGLGWTLQAGGMITQSVHGMPDNLSTVLPYQPPNTSGPLIDSQLLLNRVAHGLADSSPDLFNFNFAGYSGQFFIYQNQAHFLLYQDLKVDYDSQANRFTITAGNGTVYKFFRQEVSINQMLNQSAIQTDTNSWLLTEITSADGNNTLTLTYDPTPEQYTTPTGQLIEDHYQGFATGVVSNNINMNLECQMYDRSMPRETTSAYRVTTTAYRLLRIESPLERIEFVPQSTSRLDVNGTAYALAIIQIYDKTHSNTTPIHNFNLQQSYFGTPTPRYGRLKLESVQEVGEGGLNKPPYLFEYQDGNFPGRDDRSVDHWGYFNAAGNTSMLPATQNYPQGTANRTPSLQATLLSTLQKVTYPTGGFETFTYEQNMYYPTTSGNATPGPGVRIQQIMAQSATGVVTYRNFSYTNPINERLVPQYETTTIDNPGTNCDCMLVNVASNNSAFSLFGTAVCYTSVVESLGLNGEGGQTEYQYESTGEEWTNNMNLIKKTVRTSTNNKVAEEEYYYGEAEDFALPFIASAAPPFDSYLYVCSSCFPPTGPISTYTRLDMLPGDVYATTGCLRQDPSCGGRALPVLYYKTDPDFGYNLSIHYPTFLNLVCYWQYPTGKTLRTYDLGNSQLYTETTTRYFYDQSTVPNNPMGAYGPSMHRYITREETTDSEGRTHITRKRYPQEYTTTYRGGDDYYQALQNMIGLHQVDAPVEQLSLLKTGNTTTVLGGQLTLSKAYVNYTNIHPAMVLNLETDRPLPDGTYSTTTYSSITWDSHFIPRLTYDYDEVGKPLQMQPTNDTPTSYLWGFDNTLLIAEVKNATPDQIAYTSFEANSPGGWGYDATQCVPTSFTGTNGFGLGGSFGAAVQRAGLAAGNYELLLWANGGVAPQVRSIAPQLIVANAEAGPVVGDWHQYRYHITVPANTTLFIFANSGEYIWIDEVRLHPVGAQMTSYTHNPLSGATSQTDVSGRTTHYEYDGLQRLHVVRDQELNIIQKYDYHYKP